MKKLKNSAFDFSSKLRQSSVVERFKDYLAWQRSIRLTDNPNKSPDFAPVSINLDLTSACNFACPHCVDSEIINLGKSLDLDDVKKTLNVLQARGLLSVILIGGGEPTLHRNFEEIALFIKDKGLQLGIVTNGSQLGKIEKIASALDKGDWVRLSLDAACQDTFEKTHLPKKKILFKDILTNAQNIKKSNPDISLGYSFVIVWDGVFLNGKKLYPNIGEMADAVKLAAEHSFDFVSFKPCLVRLEDSHKESLLDVSEKEKEKKIIFDIKHNLKQAQQAAQGSIKLLESVNLKAIIDNKVDDLKRQPKTCHMHFFNTVVTSAGIFHCPAFRGVDNARIAEPCGYCDQELFDETLNNTANSLKNFNAEKECGIVGCFYHHVNWWVEDFICSDKKISELSTIEDDNFFF